MSRWSGRASQLAALVAARKSSKRRGVAAAQRDDLEQFAHFGGAYQLLRLCCLRQVSRSIFSRRRGEHVGNPAVDQKLRLVGVAEQIEPGARGGRRQRAEIDMGSNVLQAGKTQR